MTDLERIELAARRNGTAIQKSLWIEEPLRSFVANAFLAFADEIATTIKDKKEPIT